MLAVRKAMRDNGPEPDVVASLTRLAGVFTVQ